jgi:GntR family transcriptional regulator of vanillate catabolism
MNVLATDSDADSAALSQTVRTQLRLRELILGGELPPGARIAELALVERLGASRTPIRMALVRQQEEGLLDALPNGGFAARDFSETDIHDAIEVRGTLEGLAARLAAERGVGSRLLNDARDCLERIDALLAAPRLSDESFSGYVQHNGRFHELLAQMAGSAMMQRQLDRAKALPFASPNSFVLSRSTGAPARDMLVVAQHQHRAVLDAIRKREGARAESLMREHARIAHDNLRQALRDHRTWAQMPGALLLLRDADGAAPARTLGAKR